ncbi:MAG: hypothetical protein JO318_14455 [Chloroflexi bacterium]|nr:hypothetical protein [Chloroflexota bacterium]
MPAVASLAGPTPQPTVGGARQVGQWDWGGFLLGLLAFLALLGIAAWALTRRTVVRWGARPNPVEDPHA